MLQAQKALMDMIRVLAGHEDAATTLGYTHVSLDTPLTSQRKKPLPTHVVIRDHGLKIFSSSCRSRTHPPECFFRPIAMG